MGRVVVRVCVKNYDDVLRAQRGEIPPAVVRQVEIDSLVDTGATFFCFARSLVDQLGLAFVRSKESQTVAGPITLGIYAPALIEAQGRSCITQTLALPESRQTLVGQIPLEMMNWWVDVKNQKMAGNPDHGGK